MLLTRSGTKNVAAFTVCELGYLDEWRDGNWIRRGTAYLIYSDFISFYKSRVNIFAQNLPILTTFLPVTLFSLPQSLLTMLPFLALGTAFLGTLASAQQPSKDEISPSGGPYDTIPRLGFGTWMLDDEKNATEAVAMAMVNGYRHFDCATAYQNQVAVGKGLAEGLKRTGLNRSEIWVSSKLWSTRYVRPC